MCGLTVTSLEAIQRRACVTASVSKVDFITCEIHVQKQSTQTAVYFDVAGVLQNKKDVVS